MYSRASLITIIESEVLQASETLGFAHLDPRVRAALCEVPRDALVPPAQRELAYADHPLPIGSGQTISQPFIVAIMSQLLQCRAGDRVLELGTGSGYQAAILAAMGFDVYSVEIVPELAERARTHLTELGYDQVKVRTGDG